MSSSLCFPVVDPELAVEALAQARALANHAELASKQATILLVEKIARSVPRATLVGLHAPTPDEPYNLFPAGPKESIRVGLFRQLAVNLGKDGKRELAGIPGARQPCEAIERLLSPWPERIRALRQARAPGSFYAHVPLDELAHVLAVALMDADPAREWLTAREARALDAASAHGLPTPGPRL